MITGHLRLFLIAFIVLFFNDNQNLVVRDSVILLNKFKQ